MDELFEFLIPLLFILFAVIQAIASAKKKASRKDLKKPADKERSRETWTYQARGEDVREFLARLTGQQPQQPGQGDARASRQELKAGGIVPTARRDRLTAASQGAAEQARTTRHLRVEPVPAAAAAHASTTRHVTDADAPPASGGSFKNRQSTGPRAKSKEAPAAATADKALAPSARTTMERRRTGLSARVGRAQGATGAVTASDIADQHPRKGVEIPPLGVKGLRQAIVLSEILGPPLALKPPRALD